MKNKLPKNKLAPNSSTSIAALLAVCQDLHHYCLLILGARNGQESTFVGSSDYRGLIGKLEAYGRICRNISQWSTDELPAFASLSLPPVESIETVAELRCFVWKVFLAVRIVCQANRIDAYGGELIKSQFIVKATFKKFPLKSSEESVEYLTNADEIHLGSSWVSNFERAAKFDEAIAESVKDRLESRWTRVDVIPFA